MFSENTKLNLSEDSTFFELREYCKYLGFKKASEKLNTSITVIGELRNSLIDDSRPILPFLKIYNKKYNNLENINSELKRRRIGFAKVGTTVAKNKLNILAKNNAIAKAIRLAIEIDDLSLYEKSRYGMFKEWTRRNKYFNLLELIELFREQRWSYGVNEITPNIIYFDIPNCEQISYDFSKNEIVNFKLPVYNGILGLTKSSNLYALEKETIGILRL